MSLAIEFTTAIRTLIGWFYLENGTCGVLRESCMYAVLCVVLFFCVIPECFCFSRGFDVV